MFWVQALHCLGVIKAAFVSLLQCVFGGCKQCAFARTLLCVRRCITVLSVLFLFFLFFICLTRFVISSSEVHGSCSLALLSIIRGLNFPRFRERFRAKDTLMIL